MLGAQSCPGVLPERCMQGGHVQCRCSPRAELRQEDLAHPEIGGGDYGDFHQEPCFDPLCPQVEPVDSELH